MKNENKYECNAVVIKWHGSKYFLQLWSVKHDKSHDQSIEIVCGGLQKYLHTAVHNFCDPTHSLDAEYRIIAKCSHTDQY